MSEALTIGDIVHSLPEAMVPMDPPMTGKPYVDMVLVSSRWWRWGPLIICASIDDLGKEGLWLHTSVSHKRGRVLPAWQELVRVKEAIHRDRYVVVLPPRAQYVNLAEVLHLWERLDAPTVPPAVAERTQ